jgi:hypothetical protein
MGRSVSPCPTEKAMGIWERKVRDEVSLHFALSPSLDIVSLHDAFEDEAGPRRRPPHLRRPSLLQNSVSGLVSNRIRWTNQIAPIQTESTHCTRYTIVQEQLRAVRVTGHPCTEFQ